jgi:calcium-binding protein CML
MSHIPALRSFFEIYDIDKDSFLSLEELRGFLNDNKFSCQIGGDHAEQIMQENDVDLDGKLDFDDFCFIMFHEKGYVELFYECDSNHDGFIDYVELRDCMEKLGEDCDDEVIEALITENDFDGDGKLNYVEFKKMLLSLG